jgi:hypothetical protein
MPTLVEQASSLFLYARFEVPLELLKDRLEALSYLGVRWWSADWSHAKPKFATLRSEPSNR